MEILHVSKYERPAEDGGSVPIIATDIKYNKQFLLKTRYDNATAKKDYSIFNEVLSYMLIKRLKLKLNIPNIVYFVITKNDIEKIKEDFKNIKNYKKDEAIRNIENSIGINIGIEWLHNSKIASEDFSFSKTFKENIANIDAYVANRDRTKDNPNLLYYDKKVYTIDFGSAFNYYEFYDYLENELTCSSLFDRFIFDKEYLFYNDLNKVFSKKIDISEILEIIDTMPQDWQPVKKFKEQIALVLHNRVGNQKIIKATNER